MAIPIVIIHTGAQKYLENTIQITKKTNKNIYLIGDDSNKHFAGKFGIVHVPISSLEVTPEQAIFERDADIPLKHEVFCHLRVFYMRALMKKFGFERVFHMDSDCVLLYDINTYKFSEEIAYVVNNNFSNPLRMGNSIHCGLLNMHFMDKFIELCMDVYINKSKYHLIEAKKTFHDTNPGTGRICDMTLYYLLRENGLPVQALNVEKDGFIFLNNVNNCEGPDSKEQYQKEGGHIKIVDKNKVYDTVNKKYCTLFAIHFQGIAKKILEKRDVNNGDYSKMF